MANTVQLPGLIWTQRLKLSCLGLNCSQMAAEETALKVSHTGPLAKEISRPRGQSRLKGIPWKDKTDRRDFTRVYDYGYNRQEKKLSQHHNTKYVSASLR